MFAASTAAIWIPLLTWAHDEAARTALSRGLAKARAEKIRRGDVRRGTIRLPIQLRLPQWRGAMRFVPNIRYGTERYPEKVARRLRATNIAAWIGAGTVAFFAVWRFFQGVPHW